jgi:hypothetical protein
MTHATRTLDAHVAHAHGTHPGDAAKDPRTGGITFAPPAKGWKPWAPVMAAVGDLPVFAQLLSDADARKPFNGPAALIGLDVWSQRRTVLGAIPPALARTTGRARQLFVAAK